MAGGRWWRRPRVAAVAVVAAAASLACAAAAVAPVYPLYAIDSVSGGCSIEDAAVIGRSFSGVQGSYNASVLAALRSAGDVRVVSYIDSDSAKANELEMLAALPLPPNRSSGYVWLGLGFTPLGTLLDAVPAPNSTAPAAAVQARVTVSADAKGPIIATTNPQRPVFLRLGEELLLITGSAPASATHDEEHRDDDAPGGTFLLTLQRAWGNTTAAAHDAGSLAFAPVWNSDGYPGGNSDLAEYIIDPATDLAFDRLVNHTVASLRAGYSGSWFDCFSATLFRSVDMNGNSIEHGVLRNHTLESAWDFAANAWYTKVGVREQHQTLLTAVFNATVSHGVYPTVFANNMGSSYWPGDTSGGSRALLQRSAGFRPLDLYSLERFAGEEINNDKFNSGCRNLSSIKLVYNDPDELQENLAIVADAAQRGLAAGPMIAQAGCKSESLAWMPPAVRDPFEQWAYAAYLIAVESRSGSTRLGIPAFYRDATGRRYAHVHERYSWPIGNPTQTLPPDNIQGYIPEGHQSYVRPFSGGIVVLNPTNATDSGIDLGGVFVDPQSNKTMTSLDAGPHTGWILLAGSAGR